MKLRFLLLLCGLLWLSGAQAWNVELRPAADGGREIWVESTAGANAVDVYLTHYNPDAATESGRFRSWHITKGWQSGLVPVSAPEPLSFGPVAAFTPATLPADVCPRAGDRCFLALVAVPHGVNPLQMDQWTEGALLPLTVPAARERIPYMTQFAPLDSNRDANYATGGEIFAGVTDTAAPTADAPGEAAAQTEKPDLFRLEGTQILYANAQAQRLQIIETANLEQPTLTASATVAGQPREVYRLGDYYVLLQSDYNSNAGVEVDVLQTDSAGQLQIVQRWQDTTYFLESRRRNDILYVLTNDSSAAATLAIHALRIGSDGSITELQRQNVSAYSPSTAIFSDYLLVAGYDGSNWSDTVVQAFDLRDSAKPLAALPVLKVPGLVPSEFHMDVRGSHLRLVYGPADRATGSTLAVYDLADSLKEIGSIGAIAPGESLFATRFHGDFAYVVTYERTDPLWVVDLSDPTRPRISGELQVPGWSELMFFNNNRLFAVGIDDQATPDDPGGWARRVTTSLFDVADPANPLKLGGFTPLQGEVSYSWSAALDDERALLLDWNDEYAVLPVDSWEGEAATYVQAVSLANNTLSDGGRLALPVSVQRNVELLPDVLGIMGDQTFYTASWAGGTPRILGELELAHNLSWLALHDDGLWAAAYGQRGYYRIYQYDPQDLATPKQSWSVGRNYDGLISDASLAVFYTYNPLAVQVLHRDSGTLTPPQVLTENKDYYYYAQPLLHDGHFYVPRQDYAAPQPLLDFAAGEALVAPSYYYSPPQWQLSAWDLHSGAQQSYNIPGEPLGFDSAGNLVARESTEDGELRLNLVALQNNHVRLLDSQVLACNPYAAVTWSEGAAYISCGPQYYYYYREIDNTTENSLIKVVTGDARLQIAGKWLFDYSPTLLAVDGDKVLLREGYYYPYYYPESSFSGVAVADMAIMPPNGGSTKCQLYDLGTAQAQLLYELAECPAGAVVLDGTVIYSAEGFAGLRRRSQ